MLLLFILKVHRFFSFFVSIKFYLFINLSTYFSATNNCLQKKSFFKMEDPGLEPGTLRSSV